MSLIHIISLAVVQGLTEFLPVSSSGHLILFSRFMHLQDQGIGIDIALHLGSLLAVLIYFWSDISKMAQEVFKSKLIPNFKQQNNRLAWLIIIASIPALLFGFWLRNCNIHLLREPKFIGFNILFYGLILYAADRFAKKNKELHQLNLKQAFLIGLVQCLALIPGTSRSGITITMARFLHFNRVDAAKFSMLLSMPVIAGASALEAYRLVVSGSSTDIVFALQSVCFSFVASYAVIYFMMKWLKHFSFLPFVLYRVILGMLLIFMVF